MKLKYRKAVFVVTYRKEKDKIKYLILKRKLHWKGWEFPKGGVNKDESLLHAVKREIKEETGQSAFNIKKYKYHGKYKYPRLYADRPGIIGQTFHLFSAELKKPKVKIDRLEHSTYKWLDFKSALKLLTYKNKKICLKIVNKKLTKS